MEVDWGAHMHNIGYGSFMHCIIYHSGGKATLQLVLFVCWELALSLRVFFWLQYFNIPYPAKILMFYLCSCMCSLTSYT